MNPANHPPLFRDEPFNAEIVGSLNDWLRARLAYEQDRARRRLNAPDAPSADPVAVPVSWWRRIVARVRAL